LLCQNAGTVKWVLTSLLFVTGPSLGAPTHAAAQQPLLRAHAHNDYDHGRPLLDALDNGFCSVEADVFLADGQLLVGHSRFGLRKSRTLEALYFKPLAERVRANGGSVYEASAPFHLMIDFKTDGAATYAALKPLLERYRFMLTEFTGASTRPGAVTVVISGDRPQQVMEKETERLAGYDGRLSDLDHPVNRHVMPWISDNWQSHFTWRGKGELPAEERMKLNALVRRAHANGQKIRFWAAPDHSVAWKIFHDVGIDLINTDRPVSLASFLRDTASD
jgi:hypothetical protein